ncbi:MAG TPA: hypothetical protein VJ375_01750 [Gaiellaceae bacterium]|nr:hypothetical protein [Gaiellaceae bacterium]
MPPWLAPFLGASITTLLLWVALGVQRFRARRPAWASSFVRELRGWDGRLPTHLDQRSGS